jgi:hypothetical protein
MGLIIGVSICICLKSVTGSKKSQEPSCQYPRELLCNFAASACLAAYNRIIASVAQTWLLYTGTLEWRGEPRGLALTLFGDIEGGNPVGFGERRKVENVFDELIDVDVVKQPHLADVNEFRGAFAHDMHTE